jgi:hypothetical protein
MMASGTERRRASEEPGVADDRCADNGVAGRAGAEWQRDRGVTAREGNVESISRGRALAGSLVRTHVPSGHPDSRPATEEWAAERQPLA